MQTDSCDKQEIDIISHHSFLITRKTMIAYFFASLMRIHRTQQFVISPNTRQIHGMQFLGLGNISWEQAVQD